MLKTDLEILFVRKKKRKKKRMKKEKQKNRSVRVK